MLFSVTATFQLDANGTYSQRKDAAETNRLYSHIFEFGVLGDALNQQNDQTVLLLIKLIMLFLLSNIVSI